MKVRIKFSKQGPVKFIGHLDVMRYFQKAMRRAGIDIKYSGGFSPHQIMSFAAPLGLGLTSNGEYMDIEVNSMTDCKTLKNQLNEAMAEGFHVLECHRLEEQAENAMAAVAAADYTLTFRRDKAPSDTETFFKGLKEFCNQKEIITVKKAKKGEREMDLKPYIYRLDTEGDRIFMKLSAGSRDNIKPELIMEVYDKWRGESCPEFTFAIQREEVYGNTGDEEHKTLTPLGLMGEAVE